MAERQEAECTATVVDGEARPNILFTPPCACPRCAPDQTYDTSRDRGWLRVRGHQRRFRVEELTLGERGRAVLG